MNKRFFVFSLILVAVPLVVISSGTTVRAEEDPLDVIQREIDTIKKQKEDTERSLIQAQQKEHQYRGALGTLSGQLEYAQLQLASTELEIRQKELQIEEVDAEVEQARVYDERVKHQFSTSVRMHYVENFIEKILFWIDAEDLDSWANTWVYRQFISKKYREQVLASAEQLVSLEETQAGLYQQRQEFETAKNTLEQRRITLNQQIASTRSALSTTQSQQQNLSTNLTGLNEKLAQLTSQQQAILAARIGSFIVNASTLHADDYHGSLQGFLETAPSGYFGVFSIGAYTHRNGMSQWGALGRANQGQDATQILAAYYPSAQIQNNYPVMGEITVDGHGTGSFEDWYLHRIYEVPNSWPKEVLKAQAIAARTYAVRRTNNGQGSICATEACQVFKPEPKGGAWAEAVNETRGMVLVDGQGSPVSTQYAAVHGGWSKTSGWDTTDGTGGADFLEKSYEKFANAPWLYKAWWRQGYSSSGATCTRTSPWLSPEEMADIVNAHLVMAHGNADERGKIGPVTTSCWGGDPYSMNELRDVASKYGGIASATNVSRLQGIGRTTWVKINDVQISGSDFCLAFNTRAPGYLRIPQWSGSPCEGAFFNIEHK